MFLAELFPLLSNPASDLDNNKSLISVSDLLEDTPDSLGSGNNDIDTTMDGQRGSQPVTGSLTPGRHHSASVAAAVAAAVSSTAAAAGGGRGEAGKVVPGGAVGEGQVGAKHRSFRVQCVNLHWPDSHCKLNGVSCDVFECIRGETFFAKQGFCAEVENNQFLKR